MDIQAFYAYLFTKRNFCRGTIQLYQNILFPAFQMAVDNDIIIALQKILHTLDNRSMIESRGDYYVT